MNHRERVSIAFSHKTPDRTPVFEYVLLSPVADAILGHPYYDYGGNYGRWRRFVTETGSYDKAIRLYAEDRAALALKLDHDMIYCVPPPPAEVQPQKEAQDDGLYDKEDPVEKLKYSIRIRKMEMEDWKPDYSFYEVLKKALASKDLDLPIYAPSFSHGIWTNTDLMQTMIMDGETAHEYFALCTEYSLRQIEAYDARGVDIIGVGGDFAGNSPLISPELYHEFIMPELKKLTDVIRAKGRYSVNASDGNLWSVLDDFLVNSGVDAYGEIDAGAGMNMAKLKKEYGHGITFFGNLDCGNLLSFGTGDDIHDAAIKCLEDGWGDGGHVFTASNAITESVPLKNYMAMVNAYREYFGLSGIEI